jgi:hypothetical protein
MLGSVASGTHCIIRQYHGISFTFILFFVINNGYWFVTCSDFSFMWPCIVTNFLIIEPTRCTDFSNLFWKWKIYMFRTVCLSIIRSYSLYSQRWYMSYRFIGRFRAAAGFICSSILILLLLEICLQTCMTYTIAECPVNNSWWWTEELYETCRFFISKINFQKLVGLVGFIIRKLCVVSFLIFYDISTVHVLPKFMLIDNLILKLSVILKITV